MAFDTRAASDPLRRRLRRLGPLERAEEATAFVRRFCLETGVGDRAARRREAEVGRALRRQGSYEHTPEELAFGARVAWRNHARCIGRLHWKSLEVRDLRGTTDPDAMAGRLAEHMEAAFGGGRVRSIISIFAPVRNGELPPHVESEQLTQYAGYLTPEGARLGDPRNIEVTRTAESLGWRPPGPRGMFDILPVTIRDRNSRRLIYDLPRTAVAEVPIAHPDHPAIAALGLQWYAVPCVSNLILSIGGIDYPCAPFNGHYMVTEIASRNLGDENRYDLLPRVAESLGVSGTALWKDRALLELNVAVLHSFRRDGVSIVDHHVASAQYMEFVQREQAAGRPPSGDWAWIVPPQAGSACPVFHLPMRDLAMVPNFYRRGSDDGAALAPLRHEEEPGALRTHWDRLKRAYRDWHRRRQ